MEISEKLSKMIKTFREKRNLSQSACSAELGVAKSTLQKLERGEAVAPQTLQHVLDQMDMELDLRPKSATGNHAQMAAAIEKLAAAAKEVQELFEEEKWN